MSRKKDRLPGKIISAVFFVLVFAFITLLVYTKLIPIKYLAIICGVLILLILIVYLLVRKFRHKIPFFIGIVLMLLVTTVMGLGSLYIFKTVNTIDSITGVNTEVAQIGVYVLNEDSADSINAAADYQFGILSDLDRESTDETVNQLNSELSTTITTQEFTSLTDLADAIIRGKVEAIILNQAYLDVIDEMDGYDKFSSMLREITTKHVETVIERTEPQLVVDPNGNTKTDDIVFTLYISGIDTRGAMTAKSRSDVNIIATVNTKTRQILLVSTPRDYFVPLSISNGAPDKLTHAGIYGVNVCMDTLGMLYEEDINYYFRLNFAGFVNIIDALGGITINSDYDFDSKNVTGYHFNQGTNFVNGEQALAFARERYAFQEGDRQRGRNQLAVIEGVINKALSPELLKNYTSVLEGVEGSFETNVPYDMLASLVRKQLNEGGNWNIVSYSVDGTGDTQKPYSMSQKAYVMVPDYSTVDKAKEMMNKVRNGEAIIPE